MNTRATSRRWATVGLLGTVGGAVTLATWAGGDHILALMLGGFYLVCCAGTYLWSRGNSDVAAILRLGGDERQRLLDSQATAAAGMVTLVFCLGGMVVDLAGGGTGNPWALICAVGGVSYAAALAALRQRG